MDGFVSAGVHWPSVLTEDMGGPLNHLEAASYYAMRERADDVGSNGGYATLRSAVRPQLCMDVLTQATGALGHGAAHYLGAEGPMPIVIAGPGA